MFYFGDWVMKIKIQKCRSHNHYQAPDEKAKSNQNRLLIVSGILIE